MHPVVENGMTGKKIKNPSSRAKLTTGQVNNFMNPVVEFQIINLFFSGQDLKII
ncbi:MAG: hypothetical protein AAB334_02050 [Patescibacteria group bacterium]